jgi:hypothetical protein
VTDSHSDTVTFAREVLGIDSFEHQVPALRSTAPYLVLAGGRRSGKSEAAQIKALHGCFTHAGGEWIVTGANEDKARDFIREAADLLQGELARGSVVDEIASRLDFANGASMIALAPTPGKIRGHGRKAIGITVEEAGFTPPHVWRDARYVLLDHIEEGVQAWLIGSPWGGPDHFFRDSFERGMDGDQDFASFQWRTSMNPRLSKGWIERERERLAPSEAAAELDGEWSNAVGSLFPRELLERNTADVEIPALSALTGPARPVLGLDWGVSFDRSAAAVIYRLPIGALNPDRELRPRFIVLPYVWPAGTPLIGDERRPGVVHEVAGLRVPWACISPEVNGVGAGPSEELVRRLRGRLPAGCRWNLVSTTAAKKTTGYAMVLSLFEREQLVAPRHPDMLRQLAGMRFEQGQRGFMHIEAEDAATHDDIADALMLATAPYVRSKGRAACRLAGPAAGGIPDAIVPPLESEEIVETSGGLRLYRRPVLQSTANSVEYTLPPGAVIEDPDRARRREQETAMDVLRDRVRAEMTTSGGVQ